MTVGMFLELIGGLGVFLLGMKTMSEALQKVAGNRLRSTLKSITGNRLLGVLTGLSVTTVIQSSSATIVMLVSFVNAGLINLVQAIGVIMGANIGTTATGWLVSLLGFQVNIAGAALPIVGIGFFMRFTRRRQLTYWGEVALGFGLLFLGLNFIKNAIPDMAASPEMAGWLAQHSVTGFFPLIKAVLVGTIATIILQSSSAAMVLVLAAAASGQIDFPTAAALILGENIGTTIKAYLASIGANLNARRTARAHMLFNVLGVVWAIILFRPLLALVDMILPGDPFTTDLALRSVAIPSHLAAFHTVFNITNTLLFLPLAGLLARLTTVLVPDEPDKLETQQLRFIDTDLVATPVLAITAARQEVGRMLSLATEAFHKVVPLTIDTSQTSMETADQIRHLEMQTDEMEKQLVDFLSHVARNSNSTRHAAEVTSMILMASDIERIGDHCESLLKLAERLRNKQISFSSKAQEEIRTIAAVVEEFLGVIQQGLQDPSSHFFCEARLMERKINEMRRLLRKEHVGRLNSGECQVLQGLIYLDMLTSFEKIGDHAINVAEALVGRKVLEGAEYSEIDCRPATI